MQILVLYFSKGGNTKRLAQAIAQGAEEVEGVKRDWTEKQSKTFWSD